MITNLLSSRSLLRQFLAFNLFVFLILGFFTFLYLLAIEPELVNRKSKKHQNIINNLSININSQNIKDDQNSLKNFLLKSKFILDEIDQIRFFNFDKEMIVDSSILDIDKKSFFVTERIQTLGINEKLNQSEDISNKNNNIKLDYNFLNDIRFRKKK
jgi:two-component system sensor histidine kinase ChvG